ncbi:Yip1 family protein [Acidimangrovimonas pyrenivorans]|uniref:Yip1 family protein n=1 Tax=Acidimangrovimonas pyrenivorans TaxID=2030798 RepID=A0ABV7AEM7_9RHOB
MMLTGPIVATLIRDSLTRPRAAMRAVLDLNLPAGILWQALVLVAVLGDLVVWGGLALTAEGRALLDQGGLPGPLFMGALQLALLALMAVGIDRIGRAFGGEGDFAGALAVIVWLQVVMFALQFAQLLLYLLVPPIADMLGIALFAVMFWLLSNFIAELHGFRSVGAVFGGVVITLIGVVIFLSFLLFALGVGVPGAP